MAGDVYTDRRRRQQRLERGQWANEYKVSEDGRAGAVQQFGREATTRNATKRSLVDPLRCETGVPPTNLQTRSKKSLEGQANRGQDIRLSETEFESQFPDLVVASPGAQRKEKAGGIVTARVLFDGTHGISVNSRIRVRDQEPSPIAADIKWILREKRRAGLSTFALTADVAEARRQLPIDRRDWHLLGSQSPPRGTVFDNTVGAFGVASASCYWSRVGAALGRLTHYLSGDTAQTWHLLVSDDLHLDARGGGYRAALMSFFILCALSEVPLSWSKTAGGDTVAWEFLSRSCTEPTPWVGGRNGSQGGQEKQRAARS